MGNHDCVQRSHKRTGLDSRIRSGDWGTGRILGVYVLQIKEKKKRGVRLGIPTL